MSDGESGATDAAVSASISTPKPARSRLGRRDGSRPSPADVEPPRCARAGSGWQSGMSGLSARGHDPRERCGRERVAPGQVAQPARAVAAAMRTSGGVGNGATSRQRLAPRHDHAHGPGCVDVREITHVVTPVNDSAIRSRSANCASIQPARSFSRTWAIVASRRRRRSSTGIVNASLIACACP